MKHNKKPEQYSGTNQFGQIAAYLLIVGTYIYDAQTHDKSCTKPRTGLGPDCHS